MHDHHIHCFTLTVIFRHVLQNDIDLITRFHYTKKKKLYYFNAHTLNNNHQKNEILFLFLSMFEREKI